MLFLRKIYHQFKDWYEPKGFYIYRDLPIRHSDEETNLYTLEMFELDSDDLYLTIYFENCRLHETLNQVQIQLNRFKFKFTNVSDTFKIGYTSGGFHYKYVGGVD